MAGDPVDSQTVPITKDRVQNCRKSAAFWVNELPRYADHQQTLADRWAIASGILAAITGLSIFPVANDGSETWVKVLVAFFAFAASMCALFPRVKNYAELAGSARELSSRYGGIVGQLIDLAEADPLPQDGARAVLEEFETIKGQKDALRGLPDRDAIELKRAEAARVLAEAQQRTAEAERAAAEARTAAKNAAKAGAGGA